VALVKGWNSQNIEEGTFTDCAYYLGTIRRGIGHSFTTATGWTARRGTWDRANNGITYRVGSDGTGRARITVDRNTANANYRVISDVVVGASGFGGPTGRDDAAASGDYYATLVRVDSSQLSVFRFDNDGAVQLAATAQAFTAGQLYRPGLSFDGGASQFVSGIETVTGATVARTSDATYTTGRIGVLTANAPFVALHVYADHGAATATYVSPTLDAGSSLAADVAGWGESLGSGDVTIDVDLRDSGNSGTYDATALSTPTGSTFTSATGQYRNFRANLSGNAQLTQTVTIAKGNDAGGASEIMGGWGGYYA